MFVRSIKISLFFGQINQKINLCVKELDKSKKILDFLLFKKYGMINSIDKIT